MSDANDGTEEKSQDLSMHPLTPEEALDGFLRVDPERVKEAEREETAESDEEANDGEAPGRDRSD